MMSFKQFVESDEAHKNALEKTGFWGNEAAGSIFLAKDTGRILVAHRSKHVQDPGTWGTWGGAIDKGESPKDAAMREAREETGYGGNIDLHHIWSFEHSSGFKYHNFLAVVETEFEPELDWETQGYKWVKYGDWPQPTHFGLIGLIKNAGNKITAQLQGLTLPS